MDVNVSFVQLRDSGFCDKVEAFAAKVQQLDGTWLELTRELLHNKRCQCQ